MKSKKLFGIKVKIQTLARIELVMNARDKQRTGLSKLSREELAALNEWLDKNAVLAPGPIDHGPH